RCSAVPCRSTGLGPAAPPSPTSACHRNCCAGSRCWPGPPAGSASLPRRCAARSAWTCTCRSTSTPATSPLARPCAGAPMAPVAPVIASTLHPVYYRASPWTGADRPPFADEWVAKIEAFRETLTRARPDVLVMVGSDHFHQLWLDNMPQFLIGKAPFYDG